MTTSQDLARFIRAFAENRIFEDVHSREQMLTWTPTGEEGVYYGLGVRRLVLGELGTPGFGATLSAPGMWLTDHSICGRVSSNTALWSARIFCNSSVETSVTPDPGVSNTAWRTY